MFSKCVLVFVFIFVSKIAYTQPPPPPAKGGKSKIVSESKKNFFTSIEGEFSINLLNDVRGYRGLRLNETSNLGTGAIFDLEDAEIKYEIGYIQLTKESLSLSKNEIKTKFFNSTEATLKEYLKIIEDKALNFNKYETFDIKTSIFGRYVYYRYIFFENKVYLLKAAFDLEQTAAVLEVFNSFKIVSNKEIIAQKIKDSTPSDLPQEITVKQIKSDLDLDRLKGKVKTIVEENQDLTGNWYSLGKVLDSESYFDQNGNRIKHIDYDYKGFPTSIKVYGFIKSEKVIKSKYIDYEYNPPPAMPAGRNTENRIVDERYDTKIILKFDDKSNLLETTSYSSSGKLSSKTTFQYEGNKVKESNYSYYENPDGKLNSQTIQTYDEKGNEIELEIFWANSKGAGSKYTYTYEEFDKKGNWTKRLVLGKESSYNGSIKEQKYYEYRTITYYD